MAKERHRNGERERSRRSRRTYEEQSGEIETQAETEHEAQISLEKIKRTGEVARTWLRPLRAALPRLRSLRETMARVPRIDVIEREQDVVVRAAVAGIAKGGIDVAVADSTLTIRGRAPSEDPEGEYSYSELPHGSFERRVSLPCQIDVDRAAGSVRDGLLELVLPKVERVRRQSIEIR